MAFALPALVLAPAFIRWTNLKEHINVGEFQLPDDDDEQEDEKEDTRSDNNFLSVPKMEYNSSRKSSISSAILGESVPAIAINRIRDRDFPAVLFVFAITQV